MFALKILRGRCRWGCSTICERASRGGLSFRSVAESIRRPVAVLVWTMFRLACEELGLEGFLESKRNQGIGSRDAIMQTAVDHRLSVDPQQFRRDPQSCRRCCGGDRMHDIWNWMSMDWCRVISR